MREFLHVDDLAEACYICMQVYNESEHINVGTGEDVRIWELANIISEVVGFSGEILWDFTKPNGTLRKVLNVDKIKSFGWQPIIRLYDGIQKTYKWYLENII
jgi:GDP-L-fucose synthase